MSAVIHVPGMSTRSMGLMPSVLPGRHMSRVHVLMVSLIRMQRAVIAMVVSGSLIFWHLVLVLVFHIQASFAGVVF